MTLNYEKNTLQRYWIDDQEITFYEMFFCTSIWILIQFIITFVILDKIENEIIYFVLFFIVLVFTPLLVIYGFALLKYYYQEKGEKK